MANTRGERVSSQIRSTMMITLLIIGSKVLGFVRNAVMLSTFGRGLEMDAYTNASTLLSLFTLLFSAGVSSTFIPLYTSEKMHNGLFSANRYANNIVNFYGIAGLVLSVLGVLAFGSENFLRLFFPARVAAATAPLARILMSSLAITAVWQVLINVLNANRSFVPETFQGYILSVCVIAASVLTGDMHKVAIATAFAPVLQLLSVFPYLRGRYFYRPQIYWSDPKFKRTFLLALPALISMAFDEVNNMADTVFTGMMAEGSKTTLNNCYTLVVLLQGALVVPTTTVTYPQLSKYASEKNTQGIIRSIKRNTELIGFLLLPSATLLIVMRAELISVMYQRGQFGPEDVQATLLPLALYLVGAFGFGLRNFQTRVFYSMQKTRWPMVTGAVAVVVNILLSSTLRKSMGVAGLTLGTSIAGTLCAVLMLSILRRLLGPMQLKSTVGQLLRIVIATALAGGMTLLLRNIWPLNATTFLRTLAKLATCGIVGVITYVLAAWLLGVEAFHDVKTTLMKKI